MSCGTPKIVVRKLATEVEKSWKGVADGTHVGFVRDHLRARAARNEAVEARDGAAGDRHEEDREERLVLDFKAHEGREFDRRIDDDDADHAGGDHADQKKHRQIVARVLEEPHRHHGRGEEVGEDDVAPGHAVEIDRVGDAEPDHDDHEDDAHSELHARGRTHVLEVESEENGARHVDERNGACGGVREDLGAVLREAVEGVRDHVAEGGDHKEGKEPAEKEEETTAEGADVVFNQHADRAAVVLDRGVEGREVLHGAEEDAAHDHPEKSREPSEHRGDDRARHRARARNRSELVRKNRPAVLRREVVAVVETLCRCERCGVDAPGLFQPATVEAVAEEEDHHGSHHDCESVHF